MSGSYTGISHGYGKAVIALILLVLEGVSFPGLIFAGSSRDSFHTVLHSAFAEWRTTSFPSLNIEDPTLGVETLVFIVAVEQMTIISGYSIRETEAFIIISQSHLSMLTFQYMGVVPSSADFVSNGVGAASLSADAFQGMGTSYFRDRSSRTSFLSVAASVDWMGGETRTLSRDTYLQLLLNPGIVLLIVHQSGLRVESEAAAGALLSFRGISSQLNSNEIRDGLLAFSSEGAMELLVLQGMGARTHREV